MVNPYLEDIRNKQDKFKVNIPFKGNLIVQDLSFKLNDLADQLDELMVETTRSQPKPNKAINSIFLEFRKTFRSLLNTSRAELTKKNYNLDENEHKLINDIGAYLNKPYGSYDLHILTKQAHDYYDLLLTKKVIDIVTGWEEETAYAKWQKP